MTETALETALFAAAGTKQGSAPLMLIAWQSIFQHILEIPLR
jgi:hypothetical protein